MAIAPVDESARRERIERLKRLLDERIVLLDGAMGTMIQQHKLDEAGFRGERFADYGRDLKGNNDLLALTRPEVIADIHRAYLEAGADIIETNTFNSNVVSRRPTTASRRWCRSSTTARRSSRGAVADEFARAHAARPRFVAGALGPTSRMARCRRT